MALQRGLREHTEVRRLAADAIDKLGLANEAIETLLDISIEDEPSSVLRCIETVANLADLAGQLAPRLHAKVARQGRRDE